MTISTVLPEWFASLLPAPADPVRIIYSDGVFRLVPDVADGEVEFDSVDAAYDAVPDDLHVVFDQSVLEVVDHIGDCMVLVPGRIGGRMLISRSDQEVLDAYVDTYDYWLNTVVPTYLRDPSSFRAAYSFVCDHPAFWTRQALSEDEKGVADSWRWWDTTLAIGSVWQAPLWGEDGVLHWALELGSHIAPEYSSHYHDLRLDSYGVTIEDAWVELASKVHKFFNLDGSERENVEYEKSDLELKLESALAELDGLSVSDSADE